MMDNIEAGIDECARRLRELAAEIRAFTTELSDVQHQLGLETSLFSTSVTRHDPLSGTEQSLANIGRLSSEVARISGQVSSVQLHVRLEIVLMNTLLARRDADRSTPIPWEWIITRP